MNTNLKNYTAVDWAKLVSAAATAFAAGFATGGYVGGGITAAGVIAAYLATPPAHETTPTQK